MIGILLPDGSVRSIRLMRDTSPVYAGRILSRYYTTEEKILQLMDMGDISLGRLINAPFWIDYIYIFSASGGWQYLSYHE